MKKIQLVIWVLAIHHCCCGQTFARRESMRQIARNYFRSSPFDYEFNTFLDYLLNDPTLVSKTVQKRTDTGYFYLSGYYTTHHPFFFKTRRTQVVLAESEVNVADTVPKSAMMITYQLAGYTETGKDGEEDVKNEFENFDHKYLKRSRNNNYSELKTGNEVIGAIRNYFVLPNGFTPVTAAWQKIEKDKANVFVITLRFLVNANMAILPISEDDP